MENLRKFVFAVLLTLPVMLFAGESININTADKEELMSINGIGEKRAEAIITHRDQNGPFRSVDELAEVKGVGKFFIDTNRDQLTIENNE